MNSDPTDSGKPPRLTDEQRSGSLTGIGILLGFSLTFTGQWSIGSGKWIWRSAIAVLVAGVGIVIQLSALFAILGLPQLSVEAHQNAVGRFRFGVILMLVAFALHVMVDVLTDTGILKLPTNW